MKAFEEWWKSKLRKHGKKCVERGWCNTIEYAEEQMKPYKYQYQQGWRAALKEALNHKDNIIEWIEKELEEE